jgi:hypothetical protein
MFLQPTPQPVINAIKPSKLESTARGIKRTLFFKTGYIPLSLCHSQSKQKQLSG